MVVVVLLAMVVGGEDGGGDGNGDGGEAHPCYIPSFLHASHNTIPLF